MITETGFLFIRSLIQQTFPEDSWVPFQHCDAVTSCPCLKGGAVSPCTLHDSLNKHLPTLHCVLAWAGMLGTEANSARGKETWVWSLVGEDPTCLRATEPLCLNGSTPAIKRLLSPIWQQMRQWCEWVKIPRRDFQKRKGKLWWVSPATDPQARKWQIREWYHLQQGFLVPV